MCSIFKENLSFIITINLRDIQHFEKDPESKRTNVIFILLLTNFFSKLCMKSCKYFFRLGQGIYIIVINNFFQAEQS